MKYAYKYIVYILITFLICCSKTYASCTDAEISTFKKIEKDYTVKYEYDKTTQMYNVYLKSTNPDIYYYKLFITNPENLNCETKDSETVKCYNFKPGVYDIWITGQTQTCDDVLKTLQLKIPKFNKYSEDPLCNGIEEFVLCNPGYEKEIDYDDFVSRVNTYKKNKTKNDSPKEEDKIPNSKEEENKIPKILDDIWKYIKQNWITITIVSSFVILLTITIVIAAKSIRESRRLE